MRLTTTGILMSGLIALALHSQWRRTPSPRSPSRTRFRRSSRIVATPATMPTSKGGSQPRDLRQRHARGRIGKVVEAGDPDSSTLYQLVTPASSRICRRIRPSSLTLSSGRSRPGSREARLEAAGSVAAVMAKPKFEFKLDPNSAGQPVRPPAMPENLTTEPVVVTAKPNAVVAMASSPWSLLGRGRWT